jgi:hypothetical protein
MPGPDYFGRIVVAPLVCLSRGSHYGTDAICGTACTYCTIFQSLPTRKFETEPMRINFWLCRLKPVLPCDFSNAMRHYFNYHTNITLHVFPIPCTLVCVRQTKTKPARVSFLFCRPKHLPYMISLL